MTITANFLSPVSAEWQSAINFALAQWSLKLPGADACLNIKVAMDPALKHLASHIGLNFVPLGKIGGRQIVLPAAAARLQGWTSDKPDFLLTINPTFPWHFGAGNPSSTYSAESVMTHEIGHALFMTETGVNPNLITVYQLWRESQPVEAFADDQHFVGSDHLMSVKLLKGKRGTITTRDMEVAQACGLPTSGDNRIYVVPGCVPRGRRNDTAVWLGPCDQLDPRVSGFGRIEMPGDGALTPQQADIYRLYRAAFGRCPDLGGMRYWLALGQDLQAMASAFCGTPEFASLYAAADHAAFVERLYRNVLGRAPDPAGLAYWLKRTDLNRAQLLVAFAVSAENVIGTPAFV